MKTFPPVLTETIKTMVAEARARLDDLDRALVADCDIRVRTALSHARVPLEVAAKFVSEEEIHAERQEQLLNLYEQRLTASGNY